MGRFVMLHCSLFQLDAATSDDFCPARNVGFDVGGKLFGRVADGVTAEGGLEALFHLRRREYFYDFIVNFEIGRASCRERV